MVTASVERYLAEDEEVRYDLETGKGKVVFTDRRAIFLEGGFRDVSYHQITSVETSQKANLLLLQYGSVSIIFVLWLFLMDQMVQLEYSFIIMVEEVLMIFGVVLLGSYFIFREPSICLQTPQGGIHFVPKDKGIMEVLPAIVKEVRRQG